MVGREASYRIRLVNEGTAEANHVQVFVGLPASVELLATQTRLGTVGEHHEAPTGRGVVWEVESVAAKSQHELVIAFKPTENSPIDLQVNWVCRPAAITGRIEVQQPQLAVAIEGASEVRFGQTTVFRIRVSNPGTGPAENVMVSLGAADGANQPNTLGTLAAGESRTLEVELTAKQAGEMRIQAVGARTEISRPTRSTKCACGARTCPWSSPHPNSSTPNRQPFIKFALPTAAIARLKGNVAGEPPRGGEGRRRHRQETADQPAATLAAG